MELRQFGERVLFSASLDEKLDRVAGPLTDSDPGPPTAVELPVRPPGLAFAARRTAPQMPKGQALSAPRSRAIAHHIMANHELQALEVMALVLLKFPDAPAAFRSGLAAIMSEEQRHTRMHIQRCADLGFRFGDFPVNGWIWSTALRYRSPLEYVAGLPLVFEGANLDHSVEFEQYFAAAGDHSSAAIMRAIHRDEIRHVAFGLHWLRQWKSPELSDWEAWQACLHWPIRAVRAKGDRFQREARQLAGLSPDFVDNLEACTDDSQSGSDAPDPKPGG